MVKLRDNTVPNLLKQGALRSRGYNDVPLHLGNPSQSERFWHGVILLDFYTCM